MMFSNVLERYIGIFRYADEGLCILLLFIALAKVFRTHNSILEKTPYASAIQERELPDLFSSPF